MTKTPTADLTETTITIQPTLSKERSTTQKGYELVPTLPLDELPHSEDLDQ